MKHALQRFFTYLKGVSALDLRSLALFRVCLGVLVLIDMFVRFQDFTMFYTEGGVLSLEQLHKGYGSLYTWWASEEWSMFLFGFTAWCAFLLLIGCWTRVVTVLLYVLMVSVQLRVSLVNNAGDLLLSCVLFIAIFLPLSAVWSVDACREKGSSCRLVSERYAYSSPWTLVYLIQLIVLYAMAGFSKNNGTWNYDGLGIYYALNLHTYAKSSASWLLDYSVLLWVGNYLTLILERFLWMGLMIPVRKDVIRTVLVLSFVGFHFGLFLFMELGTFPWLGMIVWLAVIPSGLWNRVQSRGELVRVLDKCKMDMSAWERKWVLVGATLFLVLMTWSGLRANKLIGYNSYLGNVVSATRLRQSWKLFSGPKKEDGWLVVAAELQDGTWVDLLREGESLNWDKPAVFSAQFPNHRQRKYFKNIRTSYVSHRGYYLDWVVKKWNQNNTENPVKSATFYYMKEGVLPGGGFAPIEKEELRVWKIKPEK
ncbi:hypothetical protein BFP72_09460 [Reichenbachiella sp. 5M10]|uniref:HTTM domain-containing protein n=1 Tax=Reichenbachiella sp. 5M10 TaxID=1889772 RepID=UPI000C14B428|nr:HTTM domain-containing protein [Reichenbachiella sp. 5M10]PIB35603.1 hypothetical protein BFP72_09460 [Reichenbachiella sp. 5M10]